MLVVPYLLVFVVFVLYPVGYGLWLARHPQSYVKLFDDPIFFRTVDQHARLPGRRASTSRWSSRWCSRASSCSTRWWIKIAVAALHPALGGAVDPDHPVGALHAQPRVGRDQHD